MRIDIDIDPSDYIDRDDVVYSMAEDVLDMLKSGRSDTARAIIADFLGRPKEAENADPEFARIKKNEAIFKEWLEIDLSERPPFWEWSHGKRLC